MSKVDDMAGGGQEASEDLFKIPGFTVPDELKDHFDYVGSSRDRAKTILLCRHCQEEKKGVQKQTANFKRHLNVSTYFIKFTFVNTYYHATP